MKILYSLVLLFILWVSGYFTNNVFAIETITGEQITTYYEKNGYTISDGYNSESTCITKKSWYNQLYPDYKRSECFYKWWNYYYFLCSSENVCNLSVTQATWTQTTWTWEDVSVNPYTLGISSDTLILLKKIVKSFQEKSETLSKEKFLELKIWFLKKLLILERKYIENTAIINIIKYLRYEITNIEPINNDVNDFLCELTWTCSVLPVEPVTSSCWISSWNNFTTAPTTWLCNSWTASIVSWTWPWTWSCSWWITRTICAAYKQVSTTITNGVCWSVNGITTSTKPTYNLCSSWITSVVNWTWPWTWTCEWSGWWTNESCRANLQSVTTNWCASTIIDGINVPSWVYWSVKDLTISTSVITWWKKETMQTFKCENNIWNKRWSTFEFISCDSWYVKSGNTCISSTNIVNWICWSGNWTTTNLILSTQMCSVW
jgi:hypothetical protein